MLPVMTKFTMVPKMPLLMKRRTVSSFLCCVEGGVLHVDGFSEVFCLWQVFSDSPALLASFASGCIPHPISFPQKVTHAFPWHNIHSASLENILSPWCLDCYNLPLSNLSLTHCISANPGFWCWVGPSGSTMVAALKRIQSLSPAACPPFMSKWINLSLSSSEKTQVNPSTDLPRRPCGQGPAEKCHGPASPIHKSCLGSHFPLALAVLTLGSLPGSAWVLMLWIWLQNLAPLGLPLGAAQDTACTCPLALPALGCFMSSLWPSYSGLQDPIPGQPLGKNPAWGDLRFWPEILQLSIFLPSSLS